MDVLIAIIATYISIQYIFPALDLLYQYYQHFISDKVGIIQVRIEQRVREFEKQYPDTSQELSPCIGFHMEQSESEFEDDEEQKENCMVKKNKMGFHK